MHKLCQMHTHTHTHTHTWFFKWREKNNRSLCSQKWKWERGSWEK